LLAVDGEELLLLEVLPPPADELDALELPDVSAAGGAELPSLPDDASLLLPPS